jgi:hypothetical protein
MLGRLTRNVREISVTDLPRPYSNTASVRRYKRTSRGWVQPATRRPVVWLSSVSCVLAVLQLLLQLTTLPGGQLKRVHGNRLGSPRTNFDPETECNKTFGYLLRCCMLRAMHVD